MFFVIYIISSIFQTYEFYLLYHCFFEECNISARKEFFTFFALFFVITIPYICFGIPIVTTLCSYGGEVLATLIYKGNWKRKILVGTFCFAIVAMAECVVAILIGCVHVDIFEQSGYHSIFATVCLPIVQYLIVRFVRNLRNIKRGEILTVAYWIITLALPVFSIYLFFIIYTQPHLNSIALVCSVCMLFLINIFTFYLYDHQVGILRIEQEKETLELQNRYQTKQLELMYQAVEQSRERRHDFLKHISMISYMNEHQSRKKISDYLQEIKEHLRYKQKYVNSGNFVLDCVLNYKIQEASKNEIRVDFLVTVPAELKLSVYDMNIVLANLLDNSVEAVREEKEKVIYIEIKYKKKGLYILVRNKYKEACKDGKGRYISTKEKNGEHGYGLNNVNSVVKQSGGFMHIKDEKHTFEVLVFMPSE